MRPVLRWLTAAVMLGVPTMVSAQQRAPKAAAPQTYDLCMAVATTTVEYSDCGVRELERQEAQLAAAWKAALAEYDASVMPGPEFDPESVKSKQALLAEQEAWIRYKDLSCQYLTEGFGSKGRMVDFPICRSKIIADRVTYLRELFKNEP
jgi:uncharacterized protein YecT (DUF1311 family)